MRRASGRLRGRRRRTSSSAPPTGGEPTEPSEPPTGGLAAGCTGDRGTWCGLTVLSDLAQRSLRSLCKHRSSSCLQHFVDRARNYSGPRVIIELCLRRCVKGSDVRIRDEVKKVVAAIDFVMLFSGCCREVLGLVVGKEIVRSASDRCCMDVKIPRSAPVKWYSVLGKVIISSMTSSSISRRLSMAFPGHSGCLLRITLIASAWMSRVHSTEYIPPLDLRRWKSQSVSVRLAMTFASTKTR